MSGKPCRCPTRKEGAQRKVSKKVKPDVATDDAVANSQNDIAAIILPSCHNDATLLLNTDVVTALPTHAQRVHVCLQQCTQCAHTCFVFRRRRQLRLHPVFLRRLHHRLAPQQARPSTPPSLPSNFLRSTVGLTSEDESPVGRTAPMLTLDLCPTAGRWRGAGRVREARRGRAL